MAREIALTKGYRAIVDDEDHARLAGFAWYAHEGRWGTYAYRTLPRSEGPRRNVSMHREILGLAAAFEGGPFVDHANGDTLDNRRRNLRTCTTAENAANMRVHRGRRFKGVSWHRASRRWRAYLRDDGRQISLGYYGTPEEAARAYDRAALATWGGFARLNFPDEAKAVS